MVRRISKSVHSRWLWPIASFRRPSMTTLRPAAWHTLGIFADGRTGQLQAPQAHELPRRNSTMSIDAPGLASRTEPEEKGSLGRFWRATAPTVMLFSLYPAIYAGGHAAGCGAWKVDNDNRGVARCKPDHRGNAPCLRKTRKFFLGGVLLLLLARAFGALTHQDCCPTRRLGYGP